VLLGQFGPVAQVIAVGVRHQDEVDLAQRVEVLVLRRRLGVLGEERIDHDHLAAHGGDGGGRLAQPQHLDLTRLGIERAERRQHEP
jgi:hypothetical protein